MNFDFFLTYSAFSFVRFLSLICSFQVPIPFKPFLAAAQKAFFGIFMLFDIISNVRK